MTKPSTALIGHTGFVGSNLTAQFSFTELFNSKNIQSIEDKEFDLVVCSGASAAKWLANSNPKGDLESLQKLMDPLLSIKAKTFVLISTIDVYPIPVDVDEDTKLEGLKNHAYGTHRLLLEKFVQEKFSNHLVLRLPGLFGNGLKKNVIYDLINSNCLEKINPTSIFQYYDLKNIWNDISLALANSHSLVNLATEPISTSRILEMFFKNSIVGQNALPSAVYQMRSKYATIWQTKGAYLYSAEKILNGLKDFIDSQPREIK